MPGATATFMVTATGSDLSYQWFMVVSGGEDIALVNNVITGIFGATSSTLLITMTNEEDHDGEMYYAIVSNSADIMVTSDTVTLTISK